MASEAATAQHTLNGRSIGGPMKPVGQNVLVKVAEAEQETKGGLILTSANQEKPTHGTAVAVGEGKFLPSGAKVPVPIKAGDVVLYGKYGGTDCEYDGVKHCFVTIDDVLCVLEGGAMSAEAVVPLFDRVLVKRDPVQEETAGGLVLGKSAEKPLSGTVVASGPGRFMENGQTEPIEFAKGDKVMFSKYSGTDFKFDGEEYMFLRVSDVFAKWE